MLEKAKWIGIGVAAVLVLIVVMQNTESVETMVLFWPLKMPRAVLLFGTGVTGFLAGLITDRWLVRRRKT